MAEQKYVATRDGFGKAIVELGEKNKNVVVLTADLTDSTKAEGFRIKFPKRFFTLGIAEQNMLGAASGLALSGKIPFACTFAVFASGRAWEQVKVSVAYMNLNVKIIASHGGITVGEDGATHQAIEDVSIMRVLPNMNIIVPSDALETEKATHAIAELDGPAYLRLGRHKVPVISNNETKFKIGEANILREGKDIAIFACGIMVSSSLDAAEKLEKQGVSTAVINMHTIKPLDTTTLYNISKKVKAIVTAEEHTIAGGLGSAIAEFLVQSNPLPIKMVGIKDEFGMSGKPEELLKIYHLTADDIVIAANDALKLTKR